MGVHKKRLFIEDIAMAMRVARLILHICRMRMVVICIGIAGLCAIISLSLAHDAQEVAVAMQAGDILLHIAAGDYRGFNPTWFLFMMLMTSPAIFVGQIIGKPLEAKLLIAGKKRQTLWSGYCLAVVMLVVISLAVLVLCAYAFSLCAGGKPSLSAAAPGVSLWHSNHAGDPIGAVQVCTFLCVLLIGCIALGFLQLFISSISNSFIVFLFQANLFAVAMLGQATSPISYLMASRCALFDAGGLDIYQGASMVGAIALFFWVAGSIFYRRNGIKNRARNYREIFVRPVGARRNDRFVSFGLLLKSLLGAGRFQLLLMCLFGIGVSLAQVADLMSLVANEPQFGPVSFGDLLCWSVWGSSTPEPLLGAITMARMPVIPFAWIIRVLLPLALVFVASLDVRKNHLVVACRSRQAYWFARCVYIFIQIGAYWLMTSLAVFCCGAALYADSSIMSSHALADLISVDGNAASLPLINSLILYIQVVCVSSALALIQECFTLFFDAKTVFLGLTSLLCISIFVSLPLLPGEHMMVAREFARLTQHLSFSSFFTVCLVSAACATCSIVWGAKKIRTLDII